MSIPGKTGYCWHCQANKAIEQFYRNRARSNGYSSTCKSCNRLIAKAWEVSDKERSPLKWKAKAFNKTYGASITEDEIKSILLRQLRKCAICDLALNIIFHVDHIVPRKLGGENKYSNLQILCAPCNMGKWSYTIKQYVTHCREVIVAQDRKLAKELTNV